MWGSNAYAQCAPPKDLGACSQLSGGHYHSLAIQADPFDMDNDGVLDGDDNCVAIANANQSDCDNDGIGDVCEIATGETDQDLDGRPDACEIAYGDFNLDGLINAVELSIILSSWGSINPPLGDLNGDGIINAADLAALLARWGSVPY